MNVTQQIKIVLVGDQNVGKTSLLRYLVDKKPLECPTATTSIYLTVEQLEVKGKTVSVNIWDTAGEEQYRSLTSVYLRSAKGVLIVFDLTHKQSFESVQYWLNCITDTLELPPVITIVGNKSDRADEQDVDDHQIESFCLSKGITYIKTSAKTGDNVKKCFVNLVEEVIEITGAVPSSPQVQLLHPEARQRICC